MVINLGNCMKYLFKCFYRKAHNHPNIWASCAFIGEDGNEKYEPQIYEYITNFH